MTQENMPALATLGGVDLSGKVKTKNGLTYASWATIWAEVLKVDIDASYTIMKQIDAEGREKPWFDDGRTGWVEVEVTIKGKTASEILPIMNFKNQAIEASAITSLDANKSIKRCLAKAVAVCCGLGLYIYQGEDVPDEVAETNEIKKAIGELVAKKCQQGDAMKKKVAETCKEYERKAFPEYSDDEIVGDYRKIDDIDILNELRRKLLALRVGRKKEEE